MSKSPKKSKHWQEFYQHFGIYLVVIGTLAFINLLLTRGSLWFIYPAAGWGIAVAIHYATALAANFEGKLKDLLTHAGTMAAIILGLFIINLRTSPGSWWFLWPALFMIASVGIHLVTFLTSEETANIKGPDEVVEETANTTEQVQPSSTTVTRTNPTASQTGLANKTLQAHLDRAFVYKQQVQKMVKATASERDKARLQKLSEQISGWVDNIERLAKQVDIIQGNDLIKQDLKSVPLSIDRLKEQLETETDPSLKSDLERTLTNRQKQLASLEQLRTMSSRAEIQMESTLSALGTIYSQILTSQSTDQVADYSHLIGEAEEETHALQDHLEALEEVKLGSAN